MNRWVNDYRIAEMIYKGYRPVIPLTIKDTGNNVTAVLMEMPDADYKNNQEINQIKNDTRSPGGGIDLTRFVKQEFSSKMHMLSASWFFKVWFRKLFNRFYTPDF